MISIDEIYKRDDGFCGICGEVVLWKFTDRSGRPHMMRPTRDHIRPKAAGGGPEPENLQLAHNLCNLKRGMGEWYPPTTEKPAAYGSSTKSKRPKSRKTKALRKAGIWVQFRQSDNRRIVPSQVFSGPAE